MKTILNLLAAGIFPAAVTVGYSQSTVQFTATSYTVAENAGAGALLVERLGDTSTAVSVDYATADGSATYPPGGAVELWTINGGGHIPTLYTDTVASEFAPRVIDWLLAHPKP